MWENFILLAIFDTCDVVYNLSISLLPPIVLDNLFGVYCILYNMYTEPEIIVTKLPSFLFGGLNICVDFGV